MVSFWIESYDRITKQPIKFYDNPQEGCSGKTPHEVNSLVTYFG